VALLGPVLWAWYVTWGLVLLAPLASGRLRRVVVAVTVAETLIGATSVLGVARSLSADGAMAAALVAAGLAAAAVLAVRAPYDVPVRSPWSAHLARHPAGVTVTAIQRPQSGQ
jgi:hypothetical protein